MLDSEGCSRVTAVIPHRLEPAFAVFQDRTPLRQIGVLLQAEATRPFALVFPGGWFGESCPRERATAA
jgi:hypothetical protein